MVPVMVAGREYSFLLDTGAAGSRVIADSFTRSFKGSETESQGGQGALGVARPAQRVVVPNVAVGPVKIDEITMEIADESAPGPASILGLDVLSGHRLDLRLSRGTLTFDGPHSGDEHRSLLTSSHGHPHVDLHWDHVRGRAIWDTGAGVTVVDRSFARRHRDLFTEVTSSVGTDAEGNQDITPMVLMAACTIGGRFFAATIAALADIAGIQPKGDPSFELIVGYPVIAQADWSMDLDRRRWGFL